MKLKFDASKLKKIKFDASKLKIERSKWGLLSWRFFAAIPIGLLTVHILATLSAMNDTARSAYSRLAPDLPINKMIVLPPVTPARQPLPFMTADARYAVCKFDTAAGQVAINALLPDHGWTITIFHQDGSSAYHAAAARGRETQIALTIVPDDDRFMGLSPEARGVINPGAAALTVAARSGLIVVRAPDRGVAYAAEDQALLANAKCAPKAY